jgi:integration host factor subunit beta
MINKSSLIRAVNKSTGFSLRDASACIDSVVDTLSGALSRGEKVELRGLGSFFTKTVSQKKYPSSFSDQNVVPPHSRIIFRPCQKLREAVWNIKNKSK